MALEPLVCKCHETIITHRLRIRGGIREMFLLFLHKNICCGYSLEPPYQGTSNEKSQHTFCGILRQLSTMFGLEKSPCLKLSILGMV